MSVTFTLDAEEAKFVRGVLKATDKLKGLEDQYKKTSRTSKKTSKSAKDDLGGIGSSAAKTAGQLIGVTSAIGGIMAGAALLKQEWQALKDVQKQAADASITFAGARNSAIVNMPNDMKVAALDKFVTATSIKTGVKEKALYTMLETGLSAKGGVSQGGFFDAVRTSAELGAKAPKLDKNVLVGGLLDLVKSTGLENAKANMGWLLEVGSQSRVTNIGLQMKNIVPAVSAMRKFGESAEQGGEWAAFLSGQMDDRSGEKTRTGLTNLAKKMELGKIVPGAGGGGGLFGGGGAAKWGMIPEEHDTLEKQLRYAADIYGKLDKDKQGQMLEKIGGEASIVPIIKGLLEKNKALWANFERVKGAIGAPGAASAARHNSMMDTFASAPQETVASVGRMMDAGIEAAKVADTEGAMISVVREKMSGALAASGMRFPGGWTKRIIAGLEFEARTFLGEQDPVDVGYDILDRRARQMEYAGPVLDMRGTPAAVPNPEYNPEQAAILRRVLAVLERMDTKLDQPVAARQGGMLD